MATMTFALESLVGEMSRGFHLPDADIPRIIAWAMAAYPNADGEPVTAHEAMLRWLQGALAGTMANVISHEADEAHKAIAAPAPITFEPL